MFRSREQIIPDTKRQLEVENGKVLNGQTQDAGHHRVSHPTSLVHFSFLLGVIIPGTDGL